MPLKHRQNVRKGRTNQNDVDRCGVKKCRRKKSNKYWQMSKNTEYVPKSGVAKCRITGIGIEIVNIDKVQKLPEISKICRKYIENIGKN